MLDPAEWLAKLDRLRGEQLFPEGRNQPVLHTKRERKRFFKLADQLAETSDAVKRERIKRALGRIAFGR
jgi:hypothetical protein